MSNSRTICEASSSDDETYISNNENLNYQMRSEDSNTSDNSETNSSKKSIIFGLDIVKSLQKEEAHDIIHDIQNRISLHLQDKEYIPKSEIRPLIKKLEKLKYLSARQQYSVRGAKRLLEKILDNFCEKPKRSISFRKSTSQRKSFKGRDPLKCISKNSQTTKKKENYIGPSTIIPTKISSDMFSTKESFHFQNKNAYKCLNQTDLNTEVTLNFKTIDIPMDFLTNDNFKTQNSSEDTLVNQNNENFKDQTESDHFLNLLCHGNPIQKEKTDSTIDFLTHNNFKAQNDIQNTLQEEKKEYFEDLTEADHFLSQLCQGNPVSLKTVIKKPQEATKSEKNPHVSTKKSSDMFSKESLALHEKLSGKESQQTSEIKSFPSELLTNKDFFNSTKTYCENMLESSGQHTPQLDDARVKKTSCFKNPDIEVNETNTNIILNLHKKLYFHLVNSTHISRSEINKLFTKLNSLTNLTSSEKQSAKRANIILEKVLLKLDKAQTNAYLNNQPSALNRKLSEPPKQISQVVFDSPFISPLSYKLYKQPTDKQSSATDDTKTSKANVELSKPLDKMSQKSLASTVVFPLSLLTNADFTNTVNTMGFSQAVNRFHGNNLAETKLKNSKDETEPSQPITFSQAFPDQNTEENEEFESENIIYQTHENPTKHNDQENLQNLSKLNNNLVNDIQTLSISKTSRLKLPKNQKNVVKYQQFEESFQHFNENFKEKSSDVPVISGSQSQLVLAKPNLDTPNTFLKKVTQVNTTPTKRNFTAVNLFLYENTIPGTASTIVNAQSSGMKSNTTNGTFTNEIHGTQNAASGCNNTIPGTYSSVVQGPNKDFPIDSVPKNSEINTNTIPGTYNSTIVESPVQNIVTMAEIYGVATDALKKDSINNFIDQIDIESGQKVNKTDADNFKIGEDVEAPFDIENMDIEMLPLVTENIVTQDKQSSSFMDIRRTYSNLSRFTGDADNSGDFCRRSAVRNSPRSLKKYKKYKSIEVSGGSKNEIQPVVDAIEPVASTSKKDEYEENHVKSLLEMREPTANKAGPISLNMEIKKYDIHNVILPESLMGIFEKGNDGGMSLFGWDKTEEKEAEATQRADIGEKQQKLTKAERIRRRKDKLKPIWDTLPIEKKVTAENVRRFGMNIFEDPVEKFLDLDVDYEEASIVLQDKEEGEKNNGFCAALSEVWRGRDFKALTQNLKSAALKEVKKATVCEDTGSSSDTEIESDEEILRRKRSDKEMKKWIAQMREDHLKFVEERNKEMEESGADLKYQKEYNEWLLKVNTKKTHEEIIQMMKDMDEFRRVRNLDNSQKK